MGWRLSSANQRKIQTDSQGIVCRGKPHLATGLPIFTATAASAGRAPRAHSTARAARRRRTRLGDGENVPGEPQSPGGGASSCNQPVTASPEIRSRRARPHDPRRKLQLAAACGVKFLIAHTAPIILDGPPARELNYQAVRSPLRFADHARPEFKGG